MRRAFHAMVVAILAVHGLAHLLGAAEGFGWADTVLTRPVGGLVAVGWLIAGALVGGTAVLYAVRQPWWWVVGGIALVTSQAMISTEWADAWAGTLGNAVLAGVVVYGMASHGPLSSRALLDAERDRVRALPPGDILSEADLEHLPAPVAAYVRRSGAVDEPVPHGFEVWLQGRIRSGADQPWMPFAAQQVSTVGSTYDRWFVMDATRGGLPVDVRHIFTGNSATMRVALLSLVPVARMAGPEATRSETVTIFNDLCVFAPGALPRAPIAWAQLDDRRVQGTFTRGDETVSAELVFDEGGDLVDWVSDDRLRASADGSTFVQQRWSTPLLGHQYSRDRRLVTAAEALWHAPPPEGEFSYLELTIDDVRFDPS